MGWDEVGEDGLGWDKMGSATDVMLRGSINWYRCDGMKWMLLLELHG